MATATIGKKKNGGEGVAKREWGAKHTCASCGVKFYDLQRNPIVCPKCGTEVEVKTARPTHRRLPAQPEPAPPAAPEATVVAAVDEATDDDNTDELIDDIDSDDEDDDLVEDIDDAETAKPEP